jgi:Fic family protein
VLTSQLEGTRGTLVDLFAAEAAGRPAPEADLKETVNYVAALEYARRELASESGLPVSIRLLNESHRRLMRGVRGQDKQPGEIRTGQVLVGDFVPPPAHLVPRLLGDLEKYLHQADGLPPLIRAGLAHVQFETIHPYQDGNGRIGRLLIALLLQHWELLDQPLLYLSAFLKRNRARYYSALDAVRTRSAWSEWLMFFLDAVEVTSHEALALAHRLRGLVDADRRRVHRHGAVSLQSVLLFEELPKHPMVSVTLATRLLGVSKPAAIRAIESLVAVGLLKETTGKKRDRLFSYEAYLGALRAGTDDPSR